MAKHLGPGDAFPNYTVLTTDELKFPTDNFRTARADAPFRSVKRLE